MDWKSTLIARDSMSRQVFDRLINDRNVTQWWRGQDELPRVRCVMLGITIPSSAMAWSVGWNTHGPGMPPSQHKHPTKSSLRFAKRG